MFDTTFDRQLVLMQLADSFFPSGSFTLSHGLESLVASNQIRTADEFQNFLRLLLQNKVGSADLVALVHAYRASRDNHLAEIRRADRQLFAHTLIQETREAQRKSGRALLMVARSLWQDPQLDTLATELTANQMPCQHPIIFAVVGRIAGLGESDTELAFLHSFLTSLLGAAIRLGVLGHIRAQLILKTLAPEIATIAHLAANTPLEEMWSCTPTIDIAQMQHRNLYQKQFMN
jgi:urease accessory protein